MPGPGAADQPRRPGAGYDRGQRHITPADKTRQIQGQPGTADDGIRPGFRCGLYGLRILPGGNHGVHGNHSRAVGELFCPANFLFQGAEVGVKRFFQKVRFPEPGVGRADAAHAAAGRHGAGQTAQRDPNAHAALQNGNGQRVSRQRQHSSCSAAMRCLAP